MRTGMMRGFPAKSAAQMLKLLCTAALFVSAGGAAAAEQSRADAWWTGPMLAPNAATLPQGHALIEPYVFDVISTGHLDTNGDKHAAAHEHDLGSLSYVLYGLTDEITAGFIPRFF